MDHPGVIGPAKELRLCHVRLKLNRRPPVFFVQYGDDQLGTYWRNSFPPNQSSDATDREAPLAFYCEICFCCFTNTDRSPEESGGRRVKFLVRLFLVDVGMVVSILLLIVFIPPHPEFESLRNTRC